MIQLADNKRCTGCFACISVCQHSAISMQPNEEGFLRPIINTDKCIGCHLCEKRCPVLHPLNININNQTAYAVISYKDRNLSSSGGAFSLFARKILNEGGVVFGASMDGQQNLRHIPIFSIDDLYKLRGSKYAQSEIGDCFQVIKKLLKERKKVLFCGTPCQVAGLYSYLNAKYEDLLITLDLVCHGVPSQLVFKTYLEKLKISTALSGGNIEEFRFRKLDSWSIVPAVKFSESKWQILEQEKNVYMEAFFKGWTYRECCFNCQYANLKRVGTFTIADFWGIGKHGIPFKKNVASGVSLVIDNHGLMSKCIEDFKQESYIECRPLDEALHENHNLTASVKREPQRDTAVTDLLNPNVSLLEYAKKYGLLEPKSIRTFFKRFFKNLIYALGLYNTYKSITYKLK